MQILEVREVREAFHLCSFKIAPNIILRTDFQEAFQKVPLTESILSLLCDEWAEDHMFSSIHEVRKPHNKYFTSLTNIQIIL